jgi:hypothetical protein
MLICFMDLRPPFLVQTLTILTMDVDRARLSRNMHREPPMDGSGAKGEE